MLYKGQIYIDYDFNITAISNMPEGNIDNLKIVCVNNLDYSSYVDAVFN